VEWSIDKNWSILGVRDYNGLFSIDLVWRKRFRQPAFGPARIRASRRPFLGSGSVSDKRR
jgi:hypothetical protein